MSIGYSVRNPQVRQVSSVGSCIDTSDLYKSCFTSAGLHPCLLDVALLCRPMRIRKDREVSQQCASSTDLHTCTHVHCSNSAFQARASTKRNHWDVVLRADLDALTDLLRAFRKYDSFCRCASTVTEKENGWKQETKPKGITRTQVSVKVARSRPRGIEGSEGEGSLWVRICSTEDEIWKQEINAIKTK